MSISIEQFSVEERVLELRYEPSYKLWDTSGQIWERVQELGWGLAVRETEPNSTQFIADERLLLTVQLEKLAITDLQPDTSAKLFAAQADEFCSLVTEVLEIKSFTRAGYRCRLYKEFESPKAASEYMGSAQAVALPKGPFFDVDSFPSTINTVYGYTAGESGVTVRLSAGKQEIGFHPPHNSLWSGEVSRTKSRHIGVIDIDQFKTGIIDSGMLGFGDWVLARDRRIRRDSHAFL